MKVYIKVLITVMPFFMVTNLNAMKLERSKSMSVGKSAFTEDQLKELFGHLSPFIEENKKLKEDIKILSENRDAIFALLTQLLLEKGDDQPLLTAVELDIAEYMHFLIKKRYSLSIRNKQKKPLLHVAVMHGSVKCAEIILKKQKKPNVIDDFKNTPLHLAVEQKNAMMVAYLRKYGSDPFQKNKSKKTPIDLLPKEKKHISKDSKIKRLLEMHPYDQKEANMILANTI